MSAAWRLAINSLYGRRNRSLLLAGAVALSAALIVCVACAMASVQSALNQQVAMTIGAADVQIKPAGSGKTLPERWLGRAQSWDGVAAAVGRLQTTMALSLKKEAFVPAPGASGYVKEERLFASTALGNSSSHVVSGTRNEATAGRTPDAEVAAILAPPPRLIAGRLAEADDEIVIDALLAYRLSHEYASSTRKRDGMIPLPVSTGEILKGKPPPQPWPDRVSSAADADRYNEYSRVGIGDVLEVRRQVFAALESQIPLPSFRAPTSLKVVGIAAQPPIGGRPQAYMTLPALAKLSGQNGLSQIDLALSPDVDPAAFVAAHANEVPKSLLIQTTQKITSGLDQNMKSSQLGMILATVLAFLSAAFIITTGLTTNVTERQRELAVLRCIGGTRLQLAATQLLVGLLLGIAGAVAGIPLGLGIAWLLTTVLHDQLPSGLAISALGLSLAATGALLCGLIGATWPAWRAARLSPLAALASRAAVPHRRGIELVTLAGLLGLLTQIAIVGFPNDGQVVFWGYATTGLPVMSIAYFLLGVPLTLIMARIAAPAVSRLLRLPPRLLSRTIQATPYRHGFTAGALMAGLALMVAIWVNGGAMLRDWIHKIDFPDAFVSGLNLPEEAQAKLNAMSDVVAGTAAITLHPVETDVFGVRALQSYKTMFVGFEPEPFFRMSSLQWVQGDPRLALERLKQGGAVIVAREFLTAKGLGVGKTFVARQDGKEYPFEIVGVVSSPGLEVASKFFNVGEDYTNQALHAVFGSREDMKQKFFGGEPAPVHLIQIDFGDKVPREDDEAALERIRAELLPYGILDAGSGRQIKDQITLFATGGLLAISTIAMVAMLVACFGVANLIIAGIDARQFEFGVLRAVGAQRSLLSRLVLGEAVIVALTACILGTLMGIQGAWAGQRIYRMLLGISLSLKIPIAPIAAGWLIVALLTLAASWPAIARLSRRQPRDLLASTRG